MCGIVGYVGSRPAAPIMINGLKRLEYRGYDSAGIALHHRGIEVIKAAGRLSALAALAGDRRPQGTVGIGHTRWATHGKPSDENSHPHTDCTGNFAVVHNGIIENYRELTSQLAAGGHIFKSETDTEAVAHLMEELWTGDLLETAQQVQKRLEGSYALAILAAERPGELVAVRQDNPLVIGLGQGEYFIASDIAALLEHTRKIVILEDGQLAHISRQGVQIRDKDGNPVTPQVTEILWDAEAVEKGGFPHFMLKEIMEQPAALRNTLGEYLREGNAISLPRVQFSPEELAAIDRIFFVACGTAYRAGLTGKYLFETLLRIPVEVDLASEFRYRRPILGPNSLLIVISQSGETADTLAAMREGQRRGARVLAITNVAGSTIAREAPNVIFTAAGPEIAVASTKAYTTQLSVIALLACYFSQVLKREEKYFDQLLQGLRELPNLADGFLAAHARALEEIAGKSRDWRDAFFIGRGLDWAVAQEGSLKLKEVSYIHAEAYAAGELKHGTLALIEEGVPVFALATQQALLEKTISNIKEVKARGAVVYAITQFPRRLAGVADAVISLPPLPDPLMPVLAVIPTQLLAYYAAVKRGLDVDKPRNLAKSVTVE